MVWYFIGVYIINRTLHGHLEIQNFSSRVEKNISLVRFTHSWNISQHSKRNLVSPSSHVISSIYMLWFKFILGLNFISLCFKLIIIHYHTSKQREIKFKPRIKLNHNIYIILLTFSPKYFLLSVANRRTVQWSERSQYWRDTALLQPEQNQLWRRYLMLEGMGQQG